MIVADSSALLAILFEEPEADRFSLRLLREEEVLMSPMNYVESHMVAFARLGAEGGRRLDALIAKLNIVVEPADARHAGVAREAFLRFGKGIHPAGLNICDCFAYALARELDAPLLYKGTDFAQTDITSAITG